MASDNLLEVDELQLYFGSPYIVNDYVTVRIPTIGEVVEYGEKRYYGMIQRITAIPSDMKASLWDMKLDWTQVENFQLFMMLVQTLTPDRTSILFGGLDFSKLKPFRNNQNGDIVLADKEAGVVIDKMIYLRIVSYLRKAFNITPKVEKAANKMTKKVLIEEDRNRIKFNQDKPFKSFLLPLISAIKVKQGYTKDYVLNMGYVEFMDDVARAQVIHNADHLLSGVYAGMIDVKKINKAELNWMKEL